MKCAAILDAANPARQLAERPREEPGVCAAAQIAYQGVRLPRTCSGAKQLHVLQQPATNPMLKMVGGEDPLQHFTKCIRRLHAAWSADCTA